MLLSSITIKHLQSIPELTVSFESDGDVTLILGANGIGKTTALQALSLLGHLPTMSVLLGKAGRWELLRPTESDRGLMHERVTDQQVEQSETERILNGSNSAKKWFAESEGTSPGGLCRFVLNHPSERQQTILYVFVRDNAAPISADALLQPEQMSLSRMLSVEALSDSEFWRYCTIVVDEIHVESMLEIARAQFLSRPNLHSGLRAKLLDVSGLSTAVHYLNTDLNDFGRGFDLRESPKDLYKDFDKFCRRFGIPRDNIESSRTIERLNSALAAVVTYPKTLQGDSTIGKKPIAVQSLQPRTLPQSPTSSAIVVRRYEDSNVATDFLSSGENEVFFLFLILLSIPEGSIVIMDEPDMHISSFQKKVFFYELFLLAKGRQLKLIVSTHSDVALTLRPLVHDVRTRIDAKVIRYGITMSSPMQSDFKEDFLVESALAHLSVALGALKNVFSFRGWKTFPQLVQSQLELNTAQVSFCLSVVGALIVAFVSFAVDLVLQDQPDHWAVVKKSLWIFFGSGTLTLLVAYIIGRLQKNRRK